MDEIELLLKVHNNLPQEGPGSNESTLKALSYIKDLPVKPKILDIGCGPGRQTVELVKATKGQVTAVDVFDRYLDVIKKRAKAEKLNNFETVKCSMDELAFDPASFDLIWAEGAIYLMGFEKGLTQWKKFLKPCGYLAVTECSWLKDDPPAEIKEFWNAGYPAMQDVKGNIDLIKKAGYELVGHFTLPEKDWWEYYNPLLTRIEMLKKQGNSELNEYIKSEEMEIELFKKYYEYYGYEFFVMKLPVDEG